MKTYRELFEAASEDQIRAQNPKASPEMVRRAAERSSRSQAQRDKNQETKERDIATGKQKALPSAVNNVSSIVRTKRGGTSKEAVGKTKPSSRDAKPSPGISGLKQTTSQRVGNGGKLALREPTKPSRKPKQHKPNKALGKLLGGAARAVSSQAKASVRDGDGAVSGSTEGPRRGLYNP